MMFHQFAKLVTNACGSPWAFLLMVIIVVGFDNATVDHIATVVTTLLAFIIQHTVNRDGKALHKKIDELIKAIDAADDNLRGIEEK